MLKLTPEVQEKINAHGVASYPYEGCGLLLGRVEDGHNIATAVYPVENRWEVEEEKRERFQITGQDMLQAELAAMAQDMEVIGVFHSHPDCPPIASPRDLDWAAWVGYSYLITEINQRQPGESRSWQLQPDRSDFIEEEIVIDAKGSGIRDRELVPDPHPLIPIPKENF